VARLHESGVHTIYAQFTDIHGTAKGKLVPLKHIESLLDPGAGFAGPSIWGTNLPRTGVDSEYYGRADLHTIHTMPWMPGYARVVLNGHVAGKPFAMCPRQILRKQVARLAERGWRLNCGLEPEFFLLQKGEHGFDAEFVAEFDAEPGDNLPKPSYDLKSLLRQRKFIESLTQALNHCGLDVFQIDHEDASGQFEINYHYADALTAADRLMLFKIAARHIAEEQGLLFSMMPKPFANKPGSGLHFHLSLADDKHQQIMAASDDPQGLGLSPTGYQFLAGLLRHAPALTALCAPTVNSYKRLLCAESLSGTSWAPSTIAYGDNNRTTVARVVYGRLEWRLPDSAANPYLALAGVIAAGLDGIERELDPGAALNRDVYQMSAQERSHLPLLPQNLGLACDALARDPVMAQQLGQGFVDEFVRLKQAEWAEYSQHVSAWERERYLDWF
jgi:glutamine synthetase